MGGQIIDATIVAAPKQRNSDGEKREIKEGRIPAAWVGPAADQGRSAWPWEGFTTSRATPYGTLSSVTTAPGKDRDNRFGDDR
jgi:hypothetical protein